MKLVTNVAIVAILVTSFIYFLLVLFIYLFIKSKLFHFYGLKLNNFKLSMQTFNVIL